MALAYEFDLPLLTEAELRLWCEIVWGVRIPDVQMCDEHATPWRAFADAYFCRYPVIVTEASRGFGGKTYLMALLALTEVVTQEVDVNILGGSGEQSTRVHEHTQKFWNYPNAPAHLLKGDPTQKITRLTNGATIRALMASSASVRGPHPVKLRLDEVDEMDLEILDAALGQPMSANGVEAQVVMSSTHQYANGTMTEIKRRATEKGWPVYSWCWRECVEPHGWLAESDVERKRRTVTKVMWNNEYELQEPAPHSRGINTEKVEAMFNRSLGEFAGDASEYIEIERPDPEGEYAHGADWARTTDFTVIITLRTDVSPMRVVAFERCHRLPWPVMVAKFEDRLSRYGGSAAHDATGLGDVIAQYLTVEAIGYIMVGKRRSDLLSEYIAAIENDEIESPYIRYMHGEHKYASTEDIYSASRHLPDSIAAGALAHYAADRGGWARGPAR